MIFISSPESPKKVKLLLLSITINAPVFDALMLEQAEITDFISVVSLSKFWFLKNLILSKKEPFFERLAEPTIRRNFLISGWKTTIKAIIPTLIKPPMILESNSISRNTVPLHKT